MSNDAQSGSANGEVNGNAAPTLATFTLENILSEHHDKIEASSRAEGWDEETGDKPVLEGYCIECEGTPRCSSRSQCFSHLLAYHTRDQTNPPT